MFQLAGTQREKLSKKLRNPINPSATKPKNNKMSINKTKNNIKIGVLALQGDFREHIAVLNKLDVEGMEIRNKKELDQVHALIIPGGESTTITKLLLRYNLFNEIKKRNEGRMPIYGTCAGAIVLAKDIINSSQPKLNLIDITIERNSYGRQVDSFESEIDVKGIGKVNGIFIRAPVISKVGKDVKVLAEHNSKVVAARQKNILVSTFHPELSDNNSLHQYFLGMVS